MTIDTHPAENDQGLWPYDFDEVPPMLSESVNRFYIRPELRPLYRRTAEQDAAVLRQYPPGESVGVVENYDGMVPTHGPVTLTRDLRWDERGDEFVCHYHALKAAVALKQAEAQLAEEARLDEVHRCRVCRTVDRLDVTPRAVEGFDHRPPVTVGPRLCGRCHAVALVELDRRRKERAEAYAAEPVGDTDRHTIVGAWLDTERNSS